MVPDSNNVSPSSSRVGIWPKGLRAMGRRLEAWGAAFLAMPCNTAHYYHPEIQAAVSIPVLHMIDLTAGRVAAGHPALRRVGVLAATAVVRTGLYTAAFERLRRLTVYPWDAEQGRLMDAIRTIKTGRHGAAELDTLQAAADSLVRAGAEALVVAAGDAVYTYRHTKPSAPPAPALATVTIFNVIPIWNDLWFPLIFIRNQEARTVTLGVTLLFGQYQTDWTRALSALSMAAVPVLIAYLLMSSQFIKGLTAGALKG